MKSNKNLNKIVLAAEYLVDNQVGIINNVKEYLKEPGDPNFFCYFAKASNTSAFCNQENFSDSGGASYSKDIALAKAIGEAVERYCSAIYDKNEFCYASQKLASFDCVDVSKFNPYAPSQYLNPNFPFTKIDEETPIYWVPALDLESNNTRYVPAQSVYIPYSGSKKPYYEPLFSQPISTGLACHESFEQAAISAIYEVIERDAFTITWQSGMSRPQISLKSLSPLNSMIVEKLQYKDSVLNIFNITLDSGIPTILSTLRFFRANSPALVVATATDLNPEIAVRKSLEELAHTRRYAQFLLNLEPLVEDYSKIISQRQHLRFWCDHKNMPMASFLFGSKEVINFNSILNEDQGCVKKNIKLVSKKIKETGYNIYLKDITSSDVETLGLYVVRALIPGYHPLQIGHNIRALGVKRLWEIPQKFGSTSIKPETGDINLPHPFP